MMETDAHCFLLAYYCLLIWRTPSQRMLCGGRFFRDGKSFVIME